MSAAAYRLRAASGDDLPSLPAIELAAGRLFPAGRIPEPDGHLPESALEAACRSGWLFVAAPLARPGEDREAPKPGGVAEEAESGPPVGFALCEVVGAALHLVELSVHPEHGRRGLGRCLVQRVIEEAAARKLEAVTLTTFADIPWNAPFYASMGFVVLPEQALTPFLATALHQEGALGMTERVAMRLPVSARTSGGDRGEDS